MDPLIILGIGGALALILLITGIIVSITSDRAIVEERLDEIVNAPEDSTFTPTQPASEDRTPLIDWLNQRVQGSSWADKVAKSLARADLKMKPGEYLALLIIAAFGTGVFIWFIGGRSIIIGIIGAIGGLFLPSMYVNRAQKQRLKTFDDQLGDMLSLMVNGLRAGYSTMQAMEAISKEMPPPICDEFRRVVQEMQLGLPMEQALDNLLRRIPSEDLDLVITAINVQREVGGNLAEVLDTISHTIRERVRIKGEVKVLTSQVMYSGRFLAMMPLFVVAILYFLNREYIMEFFSPKNNMENFPIPCGYCTLGLAGGLIVMGYIVMNKIGQIDI